MSIYRFPLYGHIAAVIPHSMNRTINRNERRIRTNLGSFDDFVVFERIEVVLDVRGGVFLDWSCAKEGVRRSGSLSTYQHKLGWAMQPRTSDLGFGDTDAEATPEALGLGDGAPCNPRKLEHTTLAETTGGYRSEGICLGIWLERRRTDVQPVIGSGVR
jgi:hypothetical protein